MSHKARRVVTVLALFGAIPVAAQTNAKGPIERGSVLVGGSAGYSHQSVDDDENDVTNYNITPSLLYFIRSRVALGGELGYSKSSTDNSSARSWVVGPAARFYFGSVRAKALPFIGAAVRRGSIKSKSSDFHTIVQASSDITEFEGISGVTWMVSHQVGISGEAYFLRTKYSFDGLDGLGEDEKISEVGLRFGIAAFIIR